MASLLNDLTYISRCGAYYRSQQLEPLGLSSRQGTTLAAICTHPGITQDQLARQVVLNKSNITRQLTALEEKGYVNRIPSPTDRRAMQLYPTDKTMALLPQIQGVYRDWSALLLQDMTEEEKLLLGKLLLQIKGKATDWMEVHRCE